MPSLYSRKHSLSIRSTTNKSKKNNFFVLKNMHLYKTLQIYLKSFTSQKKELEERVKQQTKNNKLMLHQELHRKDKA